MSLTADTADAIIAVDTAMAIFLREFGHIVAKYPEWTDLKEAIEGLQETACGEGMHFEDADEARRFRDVRDHGFVADTDEPGCDFMYSGQYRCGKTPKQHTV